MVWWTHMAGRWYWCVAAKWGDIRWSGVLAPCLSSHWLTIHTILASENIHLIGYGPYIRHSSVTKHKTYSLSWQSHWKFVMATLKICSVIKKETCHQQSHRKRYKVTHFLIKCSNIFTYNQFHYSKQKHMTKWIFFYCNTWVAEWLENGVKLYALKF